MPFPCFHQRQGRDIALAALPSSIVRELAEVCREAWHGGMLAGCNGNASCRWQSPEGERIVITRSGAAKGRLTLQDLCVLDARSGATLYGGPSSSEGLMHLEVYAARPRCGAILHTHPRQLLALALKLECQPDWQERFLKLPVFESGVWRARLGYAPACALRPPAWARPSPSAKNWNIWPPSSCWPDRVSCLRGPLRCRCP